MPPTDGRSTHGTKFDLARRISGALKSAIDAHGPVTLENRGAAAKRIAGVLYPIHGFLTPAPPQENELLRELREALTACPIVSIDREKHPTGDLLGMRRSDAARALKAIEDRFSAAPPQVTPPTEFDYEQLDPGIRDLVRTVHQLGFDTTDSGDGKSKPAEWYQPNEQGITEAFDFPHVVCAVDPAKLLTESARLLAALGTEWDIEATYHPRHGKATMLVRPSDERIAAGEFGSTGAPGATTIDR